MGEAICALRHNHGMTQEQLAKLIGVTQQYIQLIESGKRKPTIELVKKIASALGVTVSDLVGG